MLVWEKTNHPFKTYKTIGKYQVHAISNWYVVPKLKAGGPVQAESVNGNRVLIEGGLLIIKDNNDTSAEDNFMKAANDYFKGYSEDVHQTLAGAHIVNALSLIQAHLDLLHRKICRQKIQLARTETWILETFPHTASILVTSKREEVLEPRGDAFLKRGCMKIALNATDIVWSRELNGTCTKDIPVLRNKTYLYLQLPTHRRSNKTQEYPVKADK